MGIRLFLPPFPQSPLLSSSSSAIAQTVQPASLGQGRLLLQPWVSAIFQWCQPKHLLTHESHMLSAQLPSGWIRSLGPACFLIYEYQEVYTFFKLSSKMVTNFLFKEKKKRSEKMLSLQVCWIQTQGITKQKIKFSEFAALEYDFVTHFE